MNRKQKAINRVISIDLRNQTLAHIYWKTENGVKVGKRTNARECATLEKMRLKKLEQFTI